METGIKKNDPREAAKHFENKMAFTVGPIEINHYLEKKTPVNLIDVRRREDYEKGHIPGAVSLPQEDWESLKGLKKDDQNIIYCYSIVCHLAARAAVYFANKGFPVMELDGGMKEWQGHQLPIEKGKSRGASSNQKEASAAV